MSEKIIHLAIETSCDDTSVAILEDVNVLSCVTFSQKSHEKYGGVLPELASREHLKNLRIVTIKAIEQAKINFEKINLITYTERPGLLGSLLVGKCFAKSFAMAKNIPAIGVDHINGHILSPFLDNFFIPSFPHLCLTASGGHTQIVLVKDFLNYEILGETLDDAAGEAFDKIGKMINLNYPAGPLLEEYAKNGNHDAFDFCKTNVPNLNYSFSGIKTNFMNFLKKNLKNNPNFIQENLNDISASIQKKLMDMLLDKFALAVEKYKNSIKAISVVGGVSANSLLKKKIAQLAENYQMKFYHSEKKFCTDNAAMIGLVGYYTFLKNQ